jgi:hypothetical protein
MSRTSGVTATGRPGTVKLISENGLRTANTWSPTT